MTAKILVVDDDLDTLRLVGLMLERQGYSVVAASSGQQGLSLAKSEKPVLILLDLMMPDIDGVEVARRLRADPETRGAYIIMFTAKTQMEDKLVGFEAGADAYLTKPIQPRELVANVKAVLARTGSIGASAAPAREYKDQGEVIGVLAAKGGVGVTTVALNLGLILQSLSKKTVVTADFRPGCGMLALELGVTNPLGMTHLLDLSPTAISPEVVERELTDHPLGGRYLFSSPRPSDAGHCSDADSFDAIAKALSYLARFVIIDLGVSLTPVNQKVLERCRQVIVVLEPIAQTALQSRALIDFIIAQGISEDRISTALVNRLRAGMQLSLGQVQDQLGRPVSVVFTAAPEAAYQAQVVHQPMVLRQTDGITYQQFTSLAQKVIQRAQV